MACQAQACYYELHRVMQDWSDPTFADYLLYVDGKAAGVGNLTLYTERLPPPPCGPRGRFPPSSPLHRLH